MSKRVASTIQVRSDIYSKNSLPVGSSGHGGTDTACTSIAPLENGNNNIIRNSVGLRGLRPHNIVALKLSQQEVNMFLLYDVQTKLQ